MTELRDATGGPYDPSTPVMMAYPHGETIDAFWHQSVLKMFYVDLNNRQRLIAPGARGWNVLSIYSGALMAMARNNLVHNFMKRDYCDWLLFCDTDMYFAGDSLERLFKHCDPKTRPMVGGLCYSVHPVQELSDEFVATPTIYSFEGKTFSKIKRWVDEDFEPGSLVESDATGCAFVIIHRSVFEAVAEVRKKDTGGRPSV